MTFKIMHCPTRKTIPWKMIASHERQAQANHQQTLARLHERGGLAPCEAVAVLEDRRWMQMDALAADARLEELVAQWENWESGT